MYLTIAALYAHLICNFKWSYVVRLPSRKRGSVLVNYVFKKHIAPYYAPVSSETSTFKKYALARLYADDLNGRTPCIGDILRTYVYLSVQEYSTGKIIGWRLFVRPLYPKSIAADRFIKGSSYLSYCTKRKITHCHIKRKLAH